MKSILTSTTETIMVPSDIWPRPSLTSLVQAEHKRNDEQEHTILHTADCDAIVTGLRLSFTQIQSLMSDHRALGEM